MGGCRPQVPRKISGEKGRSGGEQEHPRKIFRWLSVAVAPPARGFPELAGAHLVKKMLLTNLAGEGPRYDFFLTKASRGDPCQEYIPNEGHPGGPRQE